LSKSFINNAKYVNWSQLIIMKSKRRLFYSVLIVLFLIMFFGVCSNKESHYSVPDFTLTDIFGNDVNLYTILRKGPVLIVCWTLWAKMGIEELDALLSYNNELDSMDITVLAISEDSRSSVPSILPFATEHKWICYYRILLDTTRTFANLYNIQAIPTTIAIDRKGEIFFNYLGYKPDDEKFIIDTLRAVLLGDN